MSSRSRTRFVSIMWLVWTAVCGAVLSLAGVFLYLNPQIPTAETYRHVRIETPFRIFAEGGQLMAEFGERRVIPLKFADVPPLFIHALLDTEDKRFYSHGGVDFMSLLNDSIELLVNREIRSGASTITMQLAKNISFSPGTDIHPQVQGNAAGAEDRAGADQRTRSSSSTSTWCRSAKRAYGAQAAAFTYYGRPLNQLDVAQLAMLAGIPQAPSAGNPINGPERAMKRRNLVLSRMLEQDSITQEQYDVAVNSPNTATVHERDLDIAAPYASEWVRQQLVSALRGRGVLERLRSDDDDRRTSAGRRDEGGPRRRFSVRQTARLPRSGRAHRPAGRCGRNAHRDPAGTGAVSAPRRPRSGRGRCRSPRISSRRCARTAKR